MDAQKILLLAAEVICSVRTVNRWLDDPQHGVSPHMQARLIRAAEKLGFELPKPHSKAA